MHGCAFDIIHITSHDTHLHQNVFNGRYVSLPVGCSGSRVCTLPAFDIIFLIKKRTKSDVKCVIIDRVDSAGSFCSDSSPQLDKVLQGDGITLETSSPWRQQHLANQIVDGTVGRGVISAAQSLPRSGDTLMASMVSLCMSWHPLYERKPS